MDNPTKENRAIEEKEDLGLKRLSYDELHQKAAKFYKREYPRKWRKHYYLFLGHLKDIFNE